MNANFNPNKGFQGDDFQSGCSVCKAMELNEYYGSQKGGASKKPAKKVSPKKPAKRSSSKKVSPKKPAKKVSPKKRGGADTLDNFVESNISLSYATQTGGTELASEYYTSAQQGSYAPYNASKDEKCGGGRKKRVLRGGISMDSAEVQMQSSMNQNSGATKMVEKSTAGGCGCGYKPKTSGRKRGGSDTYYANTLTGDDAVVEKLSTLNGQLDGGAKKRSSSKGAKKKPRKLKGGDDSAGGGSDFATTLASWGPVNTTSVTDEAYFPIFNKSTPFISKQDLIKYAAPVLSGNCPDPNPYPRAYNDDFIGGTKKRKPTKKSGSSSKSKAKPAKKSTSSSKTKAKPAKKSGSSKTKAKKH